MCGPTSPWPELDKRGWSDQALVIRLIRRRIWILKIHLCPPVSSESCWRAWLGLTLAYLFGFIAFIPLHHQKAHRKRFGTIAVLHCLLTARRSLSLSVWHVLPSCVCEASCLLPFMCSSHVKNVVQFPVNGRFQQHPQASV